MIQIGDLVIDLSDPLTLGAVIGAVLFLALLGMVFALLRVTRRSAEKVDPLTHQIGQLDQSLRILNDSQHQLAGGLKAVSETQATTQTQMSNTLENRLTAVSEAQVQAQAKMIAAMERRLEEVQKNMGESLHGTATRTAKSLGELHTRLATIDKAQTNIEKLSGDVLSLQDILSNKQARGAYGEIQLNDIVSKALSPDAYAFQATLSNGKRADCLIHLPNPPGPIVIDSKFPLEPYEAYRNAGTDAELVAAGRLMRTAVRKHIKDISERYIIEGETADGALMFLPSEAVYAELHASFPEVVREGFDARVWIVSPTTCMATLNTMRAVLKDARMREQAGAIRSELALLYKDVDRLGARVGNLDRHFSQASKDIEEIKISASKAGNRARRLDAFDFDEIADEETPAAPDVLRLQPKGK
jgi:DNA recombination protein RmuC